MSNKSSGALYYLRIFQDYLGGRIYLSFALSFFAAVSEAIGILMLLPLLQALSLPASELPAEPANELPFGGNTMLQELIIKLNLQDATGSLLLIITIAFVIKGGLTFCALGYNAYLRGQLLRELKGQLFSAYKQMNYGYYTSRDSGHFTNLINQQVDRSLMAFNSLCACGGHVVTTCIYIGFAVLIAWRFGLMALVVGLCMQLMFRSLNGYVKRLSRRVAAENGNLTNQLIQTLQAFKYITATGQSKHLGRAVDTSIARLTGYTIRTGIAAGFTQAVREPVAVAFIMGIVFVQLVVLQEPLAPILAAIMLFYRAMSSVHATQASWLAVVEFIGSMEIVHDEFKKLRSNQEPDGASAVGSLNQSIEMRDLYFAYDSQSGDVLKGVTLKIPVRHSVAFVGGSGAGKSTAVDLLTLMLKPRAGQLLIDGKPSEEIKLASWRRQLGYVSQETVTFDDSIANNICLWVGNPEEDAQLMVRIKDAARKANIDYFIETLPDGYRTRVGDRGIRLSGGQRQRLFIARELFRQPQLLILDEATSALDSESERAIQQSIDELKGSITVVIIAHRLSTVRNVDRVFVFDQGVLVEEGPYEQLRDTEGSRLGNLVAIQAL